MARSLGRVAVAALLASLAIAPASCTHAEAPAPAAGIPPTSGDGSGTSDEGRPFDNDASALVGRPAPGWHLETWLNSPPVALESLRGRVVFVRWFMGSSCPMCSATAPSLNALHHRYAARGLSVIGMYTHKDDGPLTRDLVSGYVGGYGFRFPVAIDDGWHTLRRYWLDGHEDRKFTSISVLVDKKGIVRHVHLGGRLAPTDPDFAAIEAYIEALLAEPS